MGRANECNLAYQCPGTWCPGRCNQYTYLWRGCKSEGDAWGCALDARDAATSSCRDDVRAYQKRAAQAKEAEQPEKTERERLTEESKKATQGSSGAPPDAREAERKSREAETEFERYERYTEALERQTERNAAKARRHESKADKADQQLGTDAADAAAKNAGVAQTLAELGSSLRLLSTGAQQEAGLGFAMRDTSNEKQLDRLLDLEEHFVPVVAAIPFAMLRNVFHADLRLMDKMEHTIAGFDGTSSQVVQDDSLREYAQAAFGAQSFVRAFVHGDLKAAEHFLTPAEQEAYGRLQNASAGLDWWLEAWRNRPDAKSQEPASGPAREPVLKPFRDEDAARFEIDIRDWVFFALVRGRFGEGPAK